jgi:Replication-relaxation
VSARPRTILTFTVLMLAGWVALMAWAVSSIDLTDLLSADHAGQTSRDPRSNRDRGAEVESAAQQVRDELERAPADIWHVARLPLAGLLLFGLALVPLRWSARRSRSYVRLHVLPHRSEQAEPEEVRRMMEAWHQQLLLRWWQRLLRGQPNMALEVGLAPDEEGDLAGRLTIVCPRELVPAVEGTLIACYPDSRLLQAGQLPGVEHVVRLKKRASFLAALRGLEDQQGNLVDATLNQMDALGETAVVQYTLSPTPAVFDRFSRRRFGALERSADVARVYDPSQPGLRSTVLTQELEGGLRIQHRPLFFADIRVAACSHRSCTAIAGTLRGESGAENRLVVRTMHGIGRASLYLRRLRAGAANPLPGWRRGVLSSTEIAAFWHMPSPSLKGARVDRSSVPRLLAAPQITRAHEHELMRDEHGAVGILPQDKTDGLGLIGGQKTGKTSVLCRTVRADALDPDCAVIVLMPKPGDALKALSMVPPDRTVHYLDLERPEFGINPLLAKGDAAMVADKIVDAFRDVNVEGDIRGSSDRYLRQAAQATVGASRVGALEGQPTLWDMYRLLIPSETSFRDRVVEALYPDPRFADTATFFGRELPGDLRDAPGQTVAKLDAPRNKILRLLVESLDKVLRHPIQLSLDELIRRREVLIVDGKMGTFGADNCRVMLQFVLNSLYGSLQRQQQLPEHERARVALKVDEAHLILNESFADALATLRSAGLEVVAAWQYGEQVQDPKIRAGLMSLLRQRCMFSMGEGQDARELSSIAMDVYADVIHADAESQARLRIAPDTIFNLPNTYSICSWISRGARQSAFLAQTIPLETDDDVVEHHRRAQKERGAYVPERMPDPLPDPVRKAEPKLASEVIADEEPRSLPAAPALDFSSSSIEAPNERPVVRVEGAPDTYTELDLDSVRGLIWDKVTAIAADRRHEPSHRELEILAALHAHRFLFASQIQRRWWKDSSLRAAQQGLNRMAKAGWVRRFKFQLAERGAQQRVYCLRRDGFEMAQQRSGRHGPYVSPDAKWREPEVNDPRRVLRDLHVNGWVLAFETICGRAIAGWRGPREGRLEPPKQRVRGGWRDLDPADLDLEGHRKLRGFEAEHFEPVSPDATVEIRLHVGDSSFRFDLLVELDRARSAAASEERLRRYDGLVSGWAPLHGRYRALGTPPAVVFVCEDEPSRDRLLRIADRTVVSQLAKAGAEEVDWPFPGRRALSFVLERDVHSGSLAALQLPEHPPELRVRLEGERAKPCRPRRVHLIEPRLLHGGSRDAG